MLYYPQLTTGSVAQYPIKRNNQRRTIVNVLSDGSDIRDEDTGFAKVTWDLTYEHLTAQELAAIGNLFEASEGQLSTFTFLDPTDNLLTWSEDLTHSSWTSGPLLSVTNGVADPFGGAGAIQLINIAQASQATTQTIAAASWFQYCFSVWLRADVNCVATLTARDEGNLASQSFAAGPAWTRAVFPVMLGRHADGISFGVQLPPGCRLDVFGLQAEAQLGAGSYKKTDNLAGVYPHSRFAADEYAVTATGPGQYSCKVTVESCTAG